MGSGEDFVRLMDNVEEIRRCRQHENVRFLQELEPHLRAARTVERELDRQLARRFRVFRYLRDDELGLSRIIADLLDPVAEHGQGTKFLEAMLELLPEVPGPGRSRRKATGGRNKAAAWKRRFHRFGSTAVAEIRVEVEREITARRRIDITIVIPAEDGPFCIAFENKPYADDQPGQCRDYLEFLDKAYYGRFLLVYLPPRYRMPDESSLPEKARERWKNHFFVLPYCHDDALPEADDSPGGGGEALAQDDAGEDGAATVEADASAADGPSLADWFGNCLALCNAERLRWFLREGQIYCRQQFGDLTMTDTEAAYIREYLEKNPKHLPAAFAVARAWPAVKHDVCRRFLEHLRDRVKKEALNAFPPCDSRRSGYCVPLRRGQAVCKLPSHLPGGMGTPRGRIGRPQIGRANHGDAAMRPQRSDVLVLGYAPRKAQGHHDRNGKRTFGKTRGRAGAA